MGFDELDSPVLGQPFEILEGNLPVSRLVGIDADRLVPGLPLKAAGLSRSCGLPSWFNTG